MNTDVRYMIDAERFVSWVYRHKNFFDDYRDDTKLGIGRTERKNYLRYESYPVKGIKSKGQRNTLELINEVIHEENKNLKLREEPFELINIGELILAINNAKDHNRGKIGADSFSVESTAKKIMNIILLGQLFEDNDGDYFTVTFEKAKTDIKEKEIYDYLSQIKPEKRGRHMEVFYYIPGRAFSYTQICKASAHYKNGITTEGIWDGLGYLKKIGFIDQVRDTEIFKPNFQYCRDFLQRVRN